MSKKLKWPARVLYIAVALALAIGLIGAGFVGAAPVKQSEWDDVSTPSKTDKVIVPNEDTVAGFLGSDILDFDMGPDGEVIYAILYVPGVPVVPPTGTTDFPVADYPGECALMKSEDGGVTWDDITDEVIEEDLEEEFYLVSVAPDDADFVVVAGADKVIGSNDGGADFTDTAFPTAEFNIACLDVSPERDGEYNIAVGTDKGKILRYEAGKYWGYAWKDATAYDGWDDSGAFTSIWVTSLAFSPGFAGDDTILAITTDGDSTYQQSGLWGTTKAWNDEAGGAFPDAVEIVDAPPLDKKGDTGIALPDDFTGYDSGLRYNWVYVNYNVCLSTDAPESFRAGLGCTITPPGGLAPIGEVFRIKGSSVDYAGIRCERYNSGRTYPLMASISMAGEIDDGNLMVGLAEPTACCKGIQVHRTAEWPIDLCCPQWSSAKKPPTGQSKCLVAYTPDGKKGYASTGRDPNTPTPLDESAFSVSEVEEVGKHWNQISLIDTNIDELTDVAVNPACGTIWLFSVNGKGCKCDSVWSSTDEGASYMRVWCKKLTNEVGLIRLAPEEEAEVVTVYLVDKETKTVYWNDDSGLTKWTTHTAAPLDDIMDLAVEAEDTVYAVDSAGDVSMSDKHGAPGSWSSAKDSKIKGEGHTIAVVDGYVLVGGDDGTVGYSDDSAASFSRLGKKEELGDGGKVHVAFDSYFEDNDTVYAAVTGGDQGVWRWVIDDSTSWKDLKATPLESQIGVTPGTTDDELDVDYYGIVLDNADGNPKTDADNGGVLYAAYHYDGLNGVARWLSPCTSPKAKYWDYLTNGAGGIDHSGFVTEPSALKICGCLRAATNSILWAIDANGYDLKDGEDNLFNYEDCLAKAGPDLSKVADGALIPSDPCYCWNEEFVLEWDELCNSSTYELEIALDEAFDHKVDPYDPIDVDEEDYLVEEDDLDCNQDYYWRVRVIMADDDAEVIRSWWSDTWKFTVEAGPLGAIKLTAPEDGATDVALEGVVFTWTTVAEATDYDFTLMDAAGKEIDSATVDVPGTSYVYAGKLTYDTAYTWQVTAMKGAVVLSKSPTSTFRTMAEPVPPPEYPEFPEIEFPGPPPTPAWVWVVIGIGAVLVIVVIVLIFRTRRV